MGVDQNGEHAESFVMLDETHSAHVSGEVVDFVRAPGSDFAAFFKVEVENQVLDVIETLIPIFQRLAIDGADVPVAA